MKSIEGKPIEYLLKNGFGFGGNRKRRILKDPGKKKNVEFYVKKLLIWFYLFAFAYWNRNGGKNRVKAQIIGWLGFDEVTFIDPPGTTLQCIIIASNIAKYCAIIFRGTDKEDGIRDWLKNIAVKHKDFNKIYDNHKKYFAPGKKGKRIPRPKMGEGHTGFTDSVNRSFDKIWPIVKKYRDRGHSINIGGHSKGGAEAVVFASILRWFKIPVREIVTAGQPRALDSTECDLFDYQYKYKSFRFCNPGDIVPYIPAGFDYQHTRERYVLERRGIKADLYDAGEAASNIGRRILSLFKLEFTWGINRHYMTAYIKRIKKIYEKFDISL